MLGNYLHLSRPVASRAIAPPAERPKKRTRSQDRAKKIVARPESAERQHAADEQDERRRENSQKADLPLRSFAIDTNLFTFNKMNHDPSPVAGTVAALPTTWPGGLDVLPYLLRGLNLAPR